MIFKKLLVGASIVAIFILTGCGGGGSTTTTCTLTPGFTIGLVSETIFVGNSTSLAPSTVNAVNGCTTTFKASNLPAGLNITPSTGLITGIPTTTGTVISTITLSSASATSAGNSVTNNVTFTVLKAASWAVQAATSGLPPGPASVTSLNGQLYALVSVLSGVNWLPQLWTSTNQGVSWVNTNNPPPTPTGSLHAYATVTDGTSLYVIGGVTNANGATTTTYSNAVYALTPGASTPMWTTATTAAFNTGVGYLGAAFINNALYVVGGTGPNGISNGVFASTNKGVTWQNLTSGSSPYLTKHCLVAAGNNLLAIGGYGNAAGQISGAGPSGKVFSVNVPPILWNVSSPYLPIFSTPEYVGCAYANGKVYVTGGSNGSGTISNNVYSSSDLGSTWVLEPASANFSARYIHGMTTQNGQLFVIGGLSPTDTALGDVLIGTP